MRAFADRADPGSRPTASKPTAEPRTLLQPDRLESLMASYEAEHGAPRPAELSPSPSPRPEDPDGAGFVVADRWGNAVACSLTMNRSVRRRPDGRRDRAAAGRAGQLRIRSRRHPVAERCLDRQRGGRVIPTLAVTATGGVGGGDGAGHGAAGGAWSKEATDRAGDRRAAPAPWRDAGLRAARAARAARRRSRPCAPGATSWSCRRRWGG